MYLNRSKTFSILSATSLIFLTTIFAAGFGIGSAASARHGAPPPQQGWTFGPPITYQGLTIFPVLASQDADTSEFETLDEALTSGDAVVSEEGEYLRRSRTPAPVVSSGPQVDQLVFVNRGKHPILLLAGEVVSGGNQDRVISKDRIVPVGAPPLPLDVFCVEHGRWTGDSANFSAGLTMVHPSVRERVAVEQDQNQVWAAVRGDTPPVGATSESVVVEAQPLAVQTQTATIGGRASPQSMPLSSRNVQNEIATEAPTQSYRKIYQSPKVTSSVEHFADEVNRRFERATRDLKGQRVVGVIVAYGDDVAWSDVFASSHLFEAYWPKLLRSYVVEALTRPAFREVATLDDARDFMRPATGHLHEDTEPGVYHWSQQSVGHLTVIELEALTPEPLTLHWLRVTIQ